MEQQFKIGEKICISKKFVRIIAKDEELRPWLAFVVENFTGLVTGYYPGGVIVQNKNGAEVEIGEEYVEHYIDLKTLPTSEHATKSGIKKLHVNKNAFVPTDSKLEFKIHIPEKE